MSEQNEICQFCGCEIVFRVIRGNTVPIHQGSVNCIGREFYRKDQEGIAHPTRCPRCDQPVFFLRNNGGSVWLEGLGWPWPKHIHSEDGKISHSEKIVFPENAQSLEGGRLYFVKYVGLLKSQEGFVLLLYEEKEDFRKSAKSQTQWVVEYPHDLSEALGKSLHRKCVVANLKRPRMITLEGYEFQLLPHTPKYGRRTFHST